MDRRLTEPNVRMLAIGQHPNVLANYSSDDRGRESQYAYAAILRSTRFTSSFLPSRDIPWRSYDKTWHKQPFACHLASFRRRQHNHHSISHNIRKRVRTIGSAERKVKRTSCSILRSQHTDSCTWHALFSLHQRVLRSDESTSRIVLGSRHKRLRI